VDDARILCGHPSRVGEQPDSTDAEKSGVLQVVLPLAKGGLAATPSSGHSTLGTNSLALVLTGRKDTDAAGRDTESHTPIGTSWGEIAAVGTVTVIRWAIRLIVQKHISPASPAERFAE